MYCNTKLAYAYFGVGSFQKALHVASQALELYPNIPKEELGYADALLAYSFAGNASGDFNKTLDKIKIALKIADKYDDYLLLRHAYFQLGGINLQNKRIKESLEFFMKAYHLSTTKSLRQYQHQDELNIGLGYLMSGKLDSSLFISIKPSKTHQRYMIKVSK